MLSRESPSYGVEKGCSHLVGTAAVHARGRDTANGKISELTCNLIRDKEEMDARKVLVFDIELAKHFAS